MIRLFRHPIMCLIIAGLFLAGCTYYREKEINPGELHKRNNFPVMTLHLSDSTDIPVEPLNILMTRIDSSEYRIYLKDGREIAVPLEDLQSITLKTVNKEKTFAVYGSMYLVTFILVLLAVTAVVASLIYILVLSGV